MKWQLPHAKQGLVRGRRMSSRLDAPTNREEPAKEHAPMGGQETRRDKHGAKDITNLHKEGNDEWEGECKLQVSYAVSQKSKPLFRGTLVFIRTN